MSYGIKVYSESGNTRVANESWLYKLYSFHTLNFEISEYNTQTISIPDYDPSSQRWGILWDQSPGVTVTERLGAIDVDFEPWGEYMFTSTVYIVVVKK